MKRITSKDKCSTVVHELVHSSASSIMDKILLLNTLLNVSSPQIPETNFESRLVFLSSGSPASIDHC